MNSILVQNLRYKLERRLARFQSIDSRETFFFKLAQFWHFFDHQPIFAGLAQSLLIRFPNIHDDVDLIFRGGFVWGQTDEHAAAIGYGVLRRWLESGVEAEHQLSFGVHSAAHNPPTIEGITKLFLEPFCDYIYEQLDDQSIALALLMRYKHRSEWFHRTYLWELAQSESRRAESLLALDLYSYLYDQGIDFHIEPSSLTGEVDLIGTQSSDDPLLADAKIFDADSRSKTYIRKAFRQIYTYTQQYNEPFGYLMIFKMTDKDLRFSLSVPSRNIPVVFYNHKAIFLITIDIYLNPKPVSQRDPLRVVEITEEELIRPVEEIGPEQKQVMA